MGRRDPGTLELGTFSVIAGGEYAGAILRQDVDDMPLEVFVEGDIFGSFLC